jgi:hypothetical protein
MPEIVNPLPKGLIEKTPLCSFPTPGAMFHFAAIHVAEHRLKEFVEASKRMQDIRTSGMIWEYPFLSEYVWCVYVSGFSAKTISNKFERLLHVHNIKTYFGIVPCTSESMLSDDEMDRVYGVFRNKSKAKAVQSVRRMIADMGWKEFHEKYVRGLDPVKFQELPNIGPALSCHLARNLGNLNVCKPDVHLRRLADKYGYESVQQMCESLNPNVPAGFVDLLLWLACIDHGTQDRT